MMWVGFLLLVCVGYGEYRLWRALQTLAAHVNRLSQAAVTPDHRPFRKGTQQLRERLTRMGAQ